MASVALIFALRAVREENARRANRVIARKRAQKERLPWARFLVYAGSSPRPLAGGRLKRTRGGGGHWLRRSHFCVLSQQWPMRLEQVGVDMQVSWRPSSGKGQNRGLAVPVLPGKRRWRGPRRPPHARPVLGFPAGGQAGRPSSGAARSRARGRRGGAVARGCHLVPAAAALATDGRRALRPCLPPRGLKSGKDSTAAAFQ